jgi:IS605 OrfB family transposase
MLIRKGKVYLAISFSNEVEPIKKPNDAVVGVDRGINNLAVFTDGKRQKFFGGGNVRHVRKRYAHSRSSLQRKLAETKKARKDTRSLRRVLKRQSGKSARFMKDTNHIISKEIVKFAKQTGNPIIALEKLDGIRDRSHKMRKAQRGEVNSWAFYQLDQYIQYKAEECGFDVVDVDPKYTSQGCSICGHTSPSNRNGHHFSCPACGYQLHADLNAARNIRLRGIVKRQELFDDGLPSTSLEALPDGEGKPPALAGGC